MCGHDIHVALCYSLFLAVDGCCWLLLAAVGNCRLSAAAAVAAAPACLPVAGCWRLTHCAGCCWLMAAGLSYIEPAGRHSPTTSAII